MLADLKAALAELGVIIECAIVCGDEVFTQGGGAGGAHFNQLMLYLVDARAICERHRYAPDTVYPRYSEPAVIYPCPEMARAALSLVESPETHEIVRDGVGRSKIIPFKRTRDS